MKNKEINEIINIYTFIKKDIEKQIKKFKNIWKFGDELDVYIELIFCILTPQSKAIMADKIINNLKNKNLIFTDNHEKLSNELNLVRFKNHKAKYIIETRKFLIIDDKIFIKGKIDPENLYETREWLVKNIKGIGYKEASHFLRNIGFVENIAILDRHILKNLKLFGVIDEIPKTITPMKYYEIENLLIKFSNKIKIPVGHLDFVLWYKETGFIFK